MGKYRVKREGTVMRGLMLKPWSFNGVCLRAEQAAIVKNRNSIKTHLMLQKDLSDQWAFLAASEQF